MCVVHNANILAVNMSAPWLHVIMSKIHNCVHSAYYYYDRPSTCYTGNSKYSSFSVYIVGCC